MKRLALFLLLTLALTGCGVVSAQRLPSTPPSHAAAGAVPMPTLPTASPAAVHWLTEPQAGLQPWLSALDQAHTAIDWNAYLLTNPRLIQALRDAAARGVTVRVLLAPHPYGDARAAARTRAAFFNSPVQVHLAPQRFVYDHAKYVVVDPGTSSARALLGSPNGTISAVSGHNAEDALVTTSPAITQALAAVFQADWTDHPAGATPRRTLVLSPGATPALVALLHTGGAIALMTEEVGAVPAIDAALRAHGAAARLLVPATLSAADRHTVTRLQAAGVRVRALFHPYVHAKLILTAHRTFVGSQNFTTVSLQHNREVGLITANPTVHQQAVRWFNRLWTQAQPFPAPLRAAANG